MSTNNEGWPIVDPEPSPSYTPATPEQIAEAMLRQKARGFAGVDPTQFEPPAWATAKVGRARLSVVGILAAVEDLGPDDRERFDQCYRALYGCEDVKGAGQ